MSTVVNWGVLGYARIAKNSIIPAISRADNARLYGVASRHQADLPTGEWEQSYGDYAALLADPALYARDPARFDGLMKAIAAARTEKDDAEMRWLELASHQRTGRSSGRRRATR